MKEMFKNFEDMMCGSLGIKEPWHIAGTEFDTAKKELHIYVEIRDNTAFYCPKCGGKTIRFGYEKNERIWRHGDCLFFPTFVHSKRPKIKCLNCGVQ
jgi:transposase